MNWYAFSLPSFFMLRPEVAVVLLVRAVELEDGRRVLGEVRRAVVDLVGHDRLEILAGDLDRLDLARLGACRFAWWAPSVDAFCSASVSWCLIRARPDPVRLVARLGFDPFGTPRVREPRSVVLRMIAVLLAASDLLLLGG